MRPRKWLKDVCVHQQFCRTHVKMGKHYTTPTTYVYRHVTSPSPKPCCTAECLSTSRVPQESMLVNAHRKYELSGNSVPQDGHFALCTEYFTDFLLDDKIEPRFPQKTSVARGSDKEDPNAHHAACGRYVTHARTHKHIIPRQDKQTSTSELHC